MNTNKQIDSKFATVLRHYQTQLAKQKQLGEFYEKKLRDLVSHKEKLENLARGTSFVQLEQKHRQQNDEGKTKTIISLSNKSIQLNNQSRMKNQKEKKKQESVDFEFQYTSLVKSIARNLQQIATKTQQSPTKKPFQTTSRISSSQMQKSLKTSFIKPQVNKSTLSPNKKLKTETEKQLSKKQQLILDFGNNNLLQSQDQIVNNLVQKLKQEQEKYIQGLLAQTELIVKQKMKNYLQKQIQKKEQLLYNMKQKLIDKSLNKVSSNKLTIKSGYTQKMKQLVQQGLKNRIDIT